MKKHFNTTGPVFPSKHYCIDPMQRLDWEEIRHLIDIEKYLVLHAPRQTGKTSTLLKMMDVLNAEGQYKALYVNIEAAQAMRNDVEAGLAIVCETIASNARIYDIEPELEVLTDKLLKDRRAGGVLTQQLSQWAQMSDKPIVLMLDEADSLVGDTLISLLRQIRAGYSQRPEAFPQSIILCGIRDVRDYRIHSSDQEIITGGSAFNIKAESLRMGNLSLAEVRELYAQHTTETGQPFADEIIFAALWEDTKGQPWLVNALGHEMTWKDKTARDRSTPITFERYQAARERLIRARETHLDQLTDKLKEPRVNRVISAILSGDDNIPDIHDDDLQYVEDLGLITTYPQVEISNRIYQEVIPREVTWQWQATITNQQTSWYVLPDGRLDIPALLRAFQQFFREHSDIWLRGLPFKEAGPQLVLQAFLQRIVNGGGRISREYALGRKYTDLYLEWPVDQEQGFSGEVQRVVIELKILYSNLDKTIADGLAQVAGYAEQCGADEAHLIIFNRDAEVSWDDKIWQQDRAVTGERVVGVWGC